MEKLSGEWKNFKKQTIPPTAPDIQIEEMKRSFYAGALCNMQLLCKENITDEEIGGILSEAKSLFEDLIKNKDHHKKVYREKIKRHNDN